MDISSRRPLVGVRAQWPITQQMDALSQALNGDGPALAFSQSPFHEVVPECALVLTTSGSTGNPKSVALSAHSVKASADAAHTYLGATAGDSWSLLLPTTHIAGVNVLARAIALGTKVLSVAEDATFTSIVPTQLHRALTGDAQLLEHLQNAKAVLVGGAATSKELRNDAEMAGINVITTYGMTEMCGGCIYNNEPLPGVEVRINEEVIELNGPMKAIGYLGEKPFGDDFFRTSDSGKFEGGKLEVLGRIDDQIISGGEKISLGTVSEFLNRDSRQRFIAVGIPDSEWGSALAIASDGEIDQRLIREKLREQFGAHCSPKHFLSNIELPLTAIGKPDIKKLMEIFGRLA